MRRCLSISDVIETVCMICACLFALLGLVGGIYLFVANGGVFEYQIVNLLAGLCIGFVVGAVVGNIFGICLSMVIFLLIKLYFALFRRTPTSLQED